MLEREQNGRELDDLKRKFEKTDENLKLLRYVRFALLICFCIPIIQYFYPELYAIYEKYHMLPFLIFVTVIGVHCTTLITTA